MTREEIIKKTLFHIAKQGKQAVNDSGACNYRGEDGTKCAVGFWIPDKLYSPTMEGKPVGDLIKHCSFYNMALPSVIIENKETFKQLQALHDDDDLWASYRSLTLGLTAFARGAGLSEDDVYKLGNAAYTGWLSARESPISIPEEV